MNKPAYKRWRRLFLRCLFFCTFLLCMIYTCKDMLYSERCDVRAVDRDHIKRANSFAEKVMQAECRPNFARSAMRNLFGSRYDANISVFVTRKEGLSESAYQYSPPFGFHHHTKLLEDILTMMPEDGLPKGLESTPCKRCIVVGSGGILTGLELGSAVDQHDIVFRLNNAPVTGHAQDVGKRTTFRMTYPEGAPVSKEEYFSDSLFVTVLFKHVDFLWLQAMLKNEILSAWNKLFFWKSVAEHLPLEANQIRIVNPLVVKETALDILQYPAPQNRWWQFREKNVPTIGVIALVLATHLCDEVSLAGFGYDLSQPDTPLHYFDNLCMNAMNKQPMHDVSKEKKLLRMLVKEGIVKDLSGGIHCAFCEEHQAED